MTRISRHQLFSLMILFEIGSTTLFALGIDAKQDAWIAILLAMLAGFVLLWIYTELQKYFPDKNLVEIIISLLGKFLGVPLTLLYAFFFLYAATRNLRDFGELIKLTFLPKTPMLAIHIIFMLTLIYLLFLGLEVMGRTSEILMPIVLFFIISIFILITMSGQVNPKELAPIMANGYKPILKAIFPALVNFPFGEIFIFSMYWLYIGSNKDVRKTSFLAMGISGLLLSVSLIIIISVMGVGYASKSTIPLLEVVKLINVGNIISNLDSFAVIIMLIGGFFKVIIFFYGGVLAISTLFKIQNKRWVIVPAGIFILWLSITFESSYPYHLWLGLKISLAYIYNTYQVIIPSLLLIICLIKKKSNAIA